MKNILKIFTALFMIAPFYGAMADISEYEECISDIEQETLSPVDPEPLTTTESTVDTSALVETPATKCQNQVDKNGIKGATLDKGECKITACDEPKYKLKNNECVSTDGDKCTPTDTNATSGKMDSGRCMPICKCGFVNIHGRCEKNNDPAKKCTPTDKNAAKGKSSCDANDKEYCKIVECKDGFTPDEKTNKCISSDSAQAKCTNTNLPDGVTEQKWNNSLKRCLHTKCDETNYKLVNSECVPKPCEPKDIEHSKTGEMKGGKCELKTCETGYEPKDGKCAPTKKAPVATTINLDDFYKKYCDNEGYYTDNTFKTPSYADFKDNCKAKKPSIIVSCYKWKNLDQDLSAITEDLKHYCSTETENRVEVGNEKRPKKHVKKDETSNTTTPTQQDCTVAKVGNGAAEVKWESDKCNIVKCDKNTYQETPVDGKCEKLPSDAYKTASQKLSELLKQAQTALTALTEQETKATKTPQQGQESAS